MLLIYFKILFSSALIFIIGSAYAECPKIPLIWNVPGKNPNFIGREDKLKKIEEVFKKDGFKTAVLAGPSGFGKSQIAKHYVYVTSNNYDIVWWFKGNQYLTQQFEHFSENVSSEFGLNIDIKAVGHAKLISIIKDFIRKKALRCLVIFDDVHTYSDIETYIPFTHENNIHTIITTRNSNFSEPVIQINAFSSEESIQYIGRFLPKEENNFKIKLALHLASCPTSIALAIDFIKSYPGMTIEKYISRYDNIANTTPINAQDAADKLGSSTDGYKMDLYSAIKLNLEELKTKSIIAFQLIGFLSFLHHDALGTDIITNWLNATKNDKNLTEVVNLINQYSLIDVTSQSSQEKVTLRMHELIQKIINMLIPVEEKKHHIDLAVEILKPLFSDRSDLVVEKVLKDNAPFLHALRISEEADKINYHTISLSSLRVKILDVLVGIIRDFSKAEQIRQHLERDFINNIKLSKIDEILYNTNLFLFSFIYSPDFDKAIIYGKKALSLIETEEGMNEEKLRLYSNLVQYYSLIGLLDNAQEFVVLGEKYFSLSKSDAYNALYILAVATYLNERGMFDEVINLINTNEKLLKRQQAYPSMYSFTLNQLCEALVKKGDIIEAGKALRFTENVGKEFYTDEDNNFFAKLNAMNAMHNFLKKENLALSKNLLNKSLNTYNKLYCGDDKHKNQGSMHLYYGKLHYLSNDHIRAKEECLISEKIYDKVLKGKAIYDVSELYKLLAIIGLDTKDESLAQEYLKKQITTFGLNHPNTLEIITYADKRGLMLTH